MPQVIAPQACYLVALARHVEQGEQVEVDEETARSLVEQGWPEPDSPDSPAQPEAPAKSPPRARKPAVTANDSEE